MPEWQVIVESSVRVMDPSIESSGLSELEKTTQGTGRNQSEQPVDQTVDAEQGRSGLIVDAEQQTRGLLEEHPSPEQHQEMRVSMM